MIVGLLARLGAGRPAAPLSGSRSWSAPSSCFFLPAAVPAIGSAGCRSASKPQCWRLRLVVLAIAASLPSACGKTDSDEPTVAACPTVVGYGADLQARVAVEVEALPQGSAVADLLSDYAVMRDQARACAG